MWLTLNLKIACCNDSMSCRLENEQPNCLCTLPNPPAHLIMLPPSPPPLVFAFMLQLPLAPRLPILTQPRTPNQALFQQHSPGPQIADANSA
jgi:hypothetical protein